MDLPDFVYLFISGHWFISTSWPLWILVLCTWGWKHVFNTLKFFGAYTQKWDCWIIWSFYFNLLRNLHIGLRSDYTVSYSSHPCWHFLVYVLLIVAVPVVGDDTSQCFWFAFLWCLVMLSIFSYSCWPFVYYLWRNVYWSLLPIFFIRLFVFLLLSCRSSLYILDINLIRYMICKYFLPFHVSLFHSVNNILQCT